MTRLAGRVRFQRFLPSTRTRFEDSTVPLKAIQERIGHALTGSFTLDVYGHTLDWKSNEEAAAKLGAEIAKSVTKADGNLDSDRLTAHNQNDLQTRSLEVVDNS